MARAIVVKKASRTAAAEQVASPGKEKSQSRERSKRPDVDVDDDAAGRHDGQGKPREGEGWGRSGFAYIRSLPQPHRGVAERIDAWAARTLSDLKRSVKWGMAWCGVGDGWCFCCGGFGGDVKLTFGRGRTRARTAVRRSEWARTRGAWISNRWTTSTNARPRRG